MTIHEPGAMEPSSSTQATLAGKADKSRTVAWISDYPIEWMEDLPSELRGLPKLHPTTWMPVLLEEFRRRRDLSLHVVVLRKGIARDLAFERDGVKFWVLKAVGGLRAPTFFWHDTLLIRRVLKRIVPDLVHAWGTERGAALVAQRLGYPYLVTIQGLLTWYQELIPLHAYERFNAAVERHCFLRGGMATTESSVAVRFLRERYPKLSVRQAEHAPNRIFHLVRRQPLTRPVRFLSVGTFGYRKGSDVLLRALDRLLGSLDFELVAVGSPDERWLAPLRQELSPKLWDRVHFKSGLSPAQVAAELAGTTMAVLPTRADTSPNAVKEAVVAGVPVVGTRIGGIVDYVFPGSNGVLCEAGDVVGLAEALQEASRHPLFSQGQVDPGTLVRTREYLSPGRMGLNFFEAYRAVLGQTD